MKVLELFSGTECLSDAFRARGHECFTVDWDLRFPSSMHIDIMELTADMVRERFGQPDVIWAGVDCSSFSVAAIGFHRMKDPVTGSLLPKTEKARRADEVNMHTLALIRELVPRLWFIENPMGGLRKMDYMQNLPRYMVTYCQYGFPYRKATDIWTNHPDPQFLPPCKNGDPCHQRAPRGTKLGLQAIQDRVLRAKYPPPIVRAYRGHLRAGGGCCDTAADGTVTTQKRHRERHDFSFNSKGVVPDLQADAGLGDEREQTVLSGR